MAGVSVKMGVDASQFKAGMQEAQNSVKTLDAALKANESQLKATGDAETYLANKAKLLSKQMEEQRRVVSGIQKEMDLMKSQGVSETSAAYQKLERSMYTATGKLMDMQAQMNSLATSEQAAAQGAEAVSTGLNSINKKISLDQVIGGIDRITTGLENAAKKAVEVGQRIWDSIMDSAAYADDTATLAARMGLTPTEVQQMQYVANRFEAPVETVAKSWKRLKMSMSSDSEEIAEGFRTLGVATQEYSQGKMGPVLTGMRDYRDVFWETGEAIMRLRDESEQERLAQKLLGRSWDELIPLFTAGREAYEEALGAAPVNSEEAIENAAELNDKIKELEQSFTVLKTEVIGSIAPALTSAAEALDGMLSSLTEYLKTEEGQQMLESLGTAVSGLFEDLGKIDPAQVVEGFTGVFNKVVEGLEWMVDNKDTLSGILTAIVIGWGAAKLTGGALQVLKLINGIRELGGFKGVENGINNLANSGQQPTTGPKTQPRTTTTPPAPTVPSGGSTAEAIAAAEALHLGGAGGSAAGIGTGITGGAGAMTLVGTVGGTVLIAGGTVALAELVNAVNAKANKAREVSTDIHRLDNLGGQTLNTIPQNLSNAMNGVMKDKRLVLQETVRAMLGYTGGNAGQLQLLKNLGYNLNENLMDAFNYTNTSGESRNKLLDMLQMNGGMTPAAAAIIMNAAGIGYNDIPREYQGAYTSAQGWLQENGTEWTRHGGLSEAVGILENYFMNSGTFNENGEWTIPGLEEDLAAQTAAAEAMQSASQTMESLPAAVAAAVSSVTLHVSLFGTPHANGIWNVPWDGYPAILHKGERVMTARENQRYTYNNYFGNVNLNNGLEIEALTESIDRRNRRQMAGYGAM